MEEENKKKNWKRNFLGYFDEEKRKFQQSKQRSKIEKEFLLSESDFIHDLQLLIRVCCFI